MRIQFDDDLTLPGQDLSPQDKTFAFPNVAGGWYILGGFAFVSVLLIVIEGMRAMQ